MRRGDIVRTTKDAEYRSINKRGGRPMVIKIPRGSIGVINHQGDPVFPKLSRRGHMPYVTRSEAEVIQ